MVIPLQGAVGMFRTSFFQDQCVGPRVVGAADQLERHGSNTEDSQWTKSGANLSVSSMIGVECGVVSGVMVRSTEHYLV